MKQRHIRHDDKLHDDEQLVVRGGLLLASVVRADAQRMFAIYSTFGISVFALHDSSVDELAQEPPLVRFPQLTLVTAGSLRSAGLLLEPTGRNPRHHTVTFLDLEAGIVALLDCEHYVWDNPYHDP